MKTLASAARTVQLEREVAEARDLLVAFQQQQALTPLPTSPKTASPSRWDGIVVTHNTPMAGLIGDIPAAWLARRGVFLDCLRLDDHLDRQRLGTIPQRHRWLFDASAALLLPVFDELHRNGGQVFVYCEDLFWNPPEQAPEWIRALMQKSATVVARRLERADAVLVATAYMAERIQRFNKNVIIIPPAPPPLSELYPRPVRAGRARRIGFAGTFSHLHDLEVLRAPVLTWLEQEPGAVFCLIGQAFPAWAEDHPRIERHAGGQRLAGYYRWVSSLDLDVFLVPLLDIRFNHGKSVLKPVEAAALGLPVICSDVAPYAGVCSEDTGQIMVANTPAAWLAALERMGDASLRTELAPRARAWAGQHTIEQVGPKWAALWGAP